MTCNTSINRYSSRCAAAVDAADVVGVARPVESAVTSCCFSRRQLKLSNAAIVLGVPYKGFLNSPTPTGEVIMKSAV
jgi:hypothetical protein